MNFLSQIGAVMALGSGQQLPPQLMQQLQGQKGLFGSILNSTQLGSQLGSLSKTGLGTQQSFQRLTMPTPPTPPANPADATAQLQYQQALQTYNTQFQAYNTQVLTLMMRQFQQLQQSMLQSQQSSKSSSTSASSSSSTANSDPIGIGSIL